MIARAGLTLGLAVGLVLGAWGCKASGAANQTPVAGSDMKAPRGAEGPLSGFQSLRRGMTPDDVLLELGSPLSTKIEMTYTYWYYSNRGDSGPHVVFDTRNMKVIRWQEI
ncbi:MAG: hypothetical protein J5J06_04000 [Phycisphaerae bacterium]|nr:hypothetical protein [Phycisphaerae bacterium]